MAHIATISEPDELAALAAEWDALPRPSPMQSPQWLLAWWRVYRAPHRQLHVAAMRDDVGQLIGLAPCYAEDSTSGRTLRWLGDGSVCSDHATILCHPQRLNEVVDALAQWLMDSPHSDWRQLRLEHIDADDVATQRLIQALAIAGYPISQRAEPGSCYIELPDSWDEFLANVSKNHRKRCRRWMRDYFDPGRAIVVVSSAPDGCRAAWHELVRLHHQRCQSLGRRGAFDESSFRAFHESAVPALAETGRCSLRTLLLDGSPVAAEYVLHDGSTWFAYQSGMSDRGGLESSGNLSILAMVRDAIDSGCRRLDLLRGVEPYKFSWSAHSRTAHTLTIRRPSVSGHLGAWCDVAWQTVKRAKKRLVAPAAS